MLRNVQNTQLRRELGLAPGFGYLWPCYPRMRDNLRGNLILRSAPILSLDTRSGLHSIGGHDVTISKEISLGLLPRFCKLGFVVSAATWFAASNARGQGYSRLGVCRMCRTARGSVLCWWWRCLGNSLSDRGFRGLHTTMRYDSSCLQQMARTLEGLLDQCELSREGTHHFSTLQNDRFAKQSGLFPRPGEYSTVGARLKIKDHTLGTVGSACKYRNTALGRLDSPF